MAEHRSATSFTPPWVAVSHGSNSARHQCVWRSTCASARVGVRAMWLAWLQSTRVRAMLGPMAAPQHTLPALSARLAWHALEAACAPARHVGPAAQPQRQRRLFSTTKSCTRRCTLTTWRHWQKMHSVDSQTSYAARHANSQLYRRCPPAVRKGDGRLATCRARTGRAIFL